MKTYQALIKRELLEHRGAFLYAPAVLLVTMFVVIILALIFGEPGFSARPDEHVTGVQIYQIGLTGTFALWSVYLMAALFFYFADSFSADRRNNSLLFWKSMPQSDLKVLTSKALAGITIFPALLIVFAMITGLLLYLMGFLVAAKLPFIPLIGPFDMISNWLQMGLVGTLYFFLTILWYAPFFGWVAGLSTLFQRWSIPLAFLIPGLVVLVEFLTKLGSADRSRPIMNFLAYRGEGLMEDKDLLEDIIARDGFNPIALLFEIFSSVNWLDMAIGLAFTALIVFFASEYRRRRIEA